MTGPIDLPLLRTLSLKGMASVPLIEAALRAQECERRLAVAVERLDVRSLPRGYALTPQGRASLKEALSREQQGVNGHEIETLYARFLKINGPFKALMHDWQVKHVDGQDVPNDHQDAAYDGRIIARLETIDAALRPLLADAIATAPRLTPYPERFADALAAIRSGDATMVAKPLYDSYHTVWFELHEELIGLCGKTRAEEAAAGRGD